MKLTTLQRDLCPHCGSCDIRFDISLFVSKADEYHARRLCLCNKCHKEFVTLYEIKFECIVYDDNEKISVEEEDDADVAESG